jgi:predicted dehydrogenase
LDTLRGYTPEYAAKLASEEEAWRQVLKSGSGGEELHVPARQELTTSHFVKSGSVLTWKFRVQDHDIGFAVRLRVQGDGGSTEVDVFANQRYSSGVTVQGEWSPSTDSALIIVWDNSYSYLREKVVAFQSCVKKMEDHIRDQQAEELKKKDTEAAAAAATATVGSSDTSEQQQPEDAPVPPTAPTAAAAEDDSPEETLVFGESTNEATPEVSPAIEEEVESAPPVEEKEKDADY